MGVISSRDLDASFKYEVAAQPGGEAIKRCLSCGACSGGCLVGEINSDFDPRKIIRSVLLGLREKILSSPSIWLCLLCGNCTFHCVQDVRFSEVMGALRYLAVKEGYIRPSFIRKLTFQTLLPSHLKLELISRPLNIYQLLGMPSVLHGSRAVNLMPARLRNLENMLPKVPFLPLSKRVKTITPPKGLKKYRVGFFLNCADDLVFSSTALATISVLSENACEVITPKGVECCGMPCSGYGELDQAKQLAKHNIDIFEKTAVEKIITDCATCGSYLKGYPNLLKDEPDYAERALAFSQKVQDISEFLIQIIDPKKFKGNLNKRVTYHEPCHLVWGQNISKQPRQLLNLVPGLEFVEMEAADRCCGGAGSYNITHYETSMEIVDKKMATISATGADLVATGCPGCRIQLQLGVKRHGLGARITHPVDLLKQTSK